MPLMDQDLNSFKKPIPAYQPSQMEMSALKKAQAMGDNFVRLKDGRTIERKPDGSYSVRPGP